MKDGAGSGDVGDNTHARIVERCRGGDHASAIEASDQPAACSARARSRTRVEDKEHRYALSTSGSLSFMCLIVSLV